MLTKFGVIKKVAFLHTLVLTSNFFVILLTSIFQRDFLTKILLALLIYLYVLYEANFVFDLIAF